MKRASFAGGFGKPSRSAFKTFGLETARANVFQGRIDVASASTARLQMRPYVGNLIEINGELVTLPPQNDLDNLATNAIQFVAINTDSLIGANGVPTGVAPSASTFYYVYVGNSRVPDSSVRQIRLCATAPTARPLDGVYYLAANPGTGYPLGSEQPACNWRLAGWVNPNASTNFIDNTASRTVANYYNRIRKNILVTPGYVNNSADTSYTTTSTTWVAANAGTGASVPYITNGEDAVTFNLTLRGSNSGATGYTLAGIGDNVATAVEAFCGHIGTTSGIGHSTTFRAIISVGVRTVFLSIAVDAGTGTVVSDAVRFGAPADPYQTYISGEVMV